MPPMTLKPLPRQRKLISEDQEFLTLSVHFWEEWKWKQRLEIFSQGLYLSAMTFPSALQLVPPGQLGTDETPIV